MQREKTDYLEVSKYLIDKGVSYADTSSNDINDSPDSEINVEITGYKPYHDLVDDIRKTLKYYLKNNTNVHYNQFFLSGGASKLNGFKALIDEQLMIETAYLDPFINIECDKVPDNPMQYTIATGLALRTLMK
jgi:Tfp pilus assembly PilM family ATPase